MFLYMFIILYNLVVLVFLVITRDIIELKTSGNLKIKEEAVFYYVNKIFRFQILLFNI